MKTQQRKHFPDCAAGRLPTALLAGALACLAAGGAAAQDVPDPWVLRIGVATVHPQSDAGRLAGLKAGVSDGTRPSIELEYLLTPHWGIEALGAAPFKHTVRLAGAGAVGVRQLPPVIGANYHFLPGTRFSPFLGLGLNYTHFYDARGQGPLQGAKVALDDTFGPAAHAGIDVQLWPRWQLTADLRWIDLGSRVKVDGAKVGTAKIDPLVYGLSIGYRF